MAALEKRLAVQARKDGKKLRLVTVFDDAPEPVAGPGEVLFVFRVIHTRDAEHTPGASWPTIVMPRPEKAETRAVEDMTDAEVELEVRQLEAERDALKVKAKHEKR